MKRNAEEKNKHVYQAPETVCLELLYESCCMQATSLGGVSTEIIEIEDDDDVNVDDWM